MDWARHLTLLGGAIGLALALLLFFLAPHLLGPWLTFTSAIAVPAGLVVVALVLRAIGRPAARAVGSVVAGVGIIWLILVGGVVVLFLSVAGIWGY